MIINHNLSAINTLNALGKNTQATSKSLQKLSTGYRINGASDDAAGLAISEKMRGQISGLKQASANLRMAFLYCKQQKAAWIKLIAFCKE